MKKHWNTSKLDDAQETYIFHSKEIHSTLKNMESQGIDKSKFGEKNKIYGKIFHD